MLIETPVIGIKLLLVIKVLNLVTPRVEPLVIPLSATIHWKAVEQYFSVLRTNFTQFVIYGKKIDNFGFSAQE